METIKDKIKSDRKFFQSYTKAEIPNMADWSIEQIAEHYFKHRPDMIHKIVCVKAVIYKTGLEMSDAEKLIHEKQNEVYDI